MFRFSTPSIFLSNIIKSGIFVDRVILIFIQSSLTHRFVRRISTKASWKSVSFTAVQIEPPSLKMSAVRKPMREILCCSWLVKPHWQWQNSCCFCSANIWSFLWNLEFLWDLTCKHCGYLTVQNKHGSISCNFNYLVWITKDSVRSNLTDLDEVTEDDTNTSCLLHSPLLDASANIWPVKQAGWGPISWPVLAGRKVGWIWVPVIS